MEGFVEQMSFKSRAKQRTIVMDGSDARQNHNDVWWGEWWLVWWSNAASAATHREKTSDRLRQCEVSNSSETPTGLWDRSLGRRIRAM